jgi:hypothetical protein
MKPLVRQFRDFFVSLELTVVLLALGIVLIFWATLAQTDLGVWGVQQKFFHTFFVLQRVGASGFLLPVFPGGYFIGGLLLLNLLAAHFYRFKYTWRKTGIWLAHAGVVLLLVGELLSGLWQKESQMTLFEGQTKNYAESFRDNELAIVDTTDPKVDKVVAIPEELLAKGDPIQTPKLPFRVIPKFYAPNSVTVAPGLAQGAAASMADQGPPFLRQFVPLPQPVTYKEDEKNLPAAYIELDGPEGPIGTWLAAEQLVVDPNQAPIAMPPQHFEFGGRSWKLSLRPTRIYRPYALTLLKVTNDIYPGTDIPKNYASRVRLSSDDGRDNREVSIYMNNPLRYRGQTYYQYQMKADAGESVLEVVRNPSWRLPYVACVLVALGLVVQFGIHLVGFAGRRAAARP